MFCNLFCNWIIALRNPLFTSLQQLMQKYTIDISSESLSALHHRHPHKGAFLALWVVGRGVLIWVYCTLYKFYLGN